MDNEQKDIQADDASKGQIAPVRSSYDVLDKTKEIRSLSDVRYFSYVSKKTEKLSTATYMITSFLADTEPMKAKLRTSALEILSQTKKLESAPAGERYSIAKRLSASIEEIVSFLEIMRSIGLVTEMNFTILKKEYESLVYVLEERNLIQGENGEYVFAGNFFNVAPKAERKVSEPEVGAYAADFPRENKNVFYEPKERPREFATEKPHQGFQKDASKTFSSAKDNRHENENASSFSKSPSLKKEEKYSRRETVLRLIREKGEVNIKDIVTHISGCSEKTIQRELATLVDANILKRTGERRWSRYSMK